MNKCLEEGVLRPAPGPQVNEGRALRSWPASQRAYICIGSLICIACQEICIRMASCALLSPWTPPTSAEGLGDGERKRGKLQDLGLQEVKAILE